MIVRIATEGQYRIDSAYLDKLNEIDNDLVAAIAAGDKDRFKVLLNDLLALVREHGTPVPAEELVESEIVLPPPDTTFEEASEMFIGDGLVPG
ncbi:PspA-associated protein PspAA [Sphaerobacter thermophilus]|jgi:hypothetical protein|uniref:PspA-associated domain-containing protein n=1 Tax=Sphaerobacter thermophilus (strain ATCC 49802 / DSM 20745 / KCCM 41009 / NCIMB 13125 / S 6022) TaxID=479434 RepID=D1C2Q5_SPHTD|nr:hypothetical protein [Sphaerobacter thermophilus]ACZ38522.1 conserved hypothetical protein [Sphaerobacter thermophilus DSM 20745]PZN67975.1 MAG: hypothetical protein DIU58_01405 [Sphaerobacter thermophilus]